MIIRSRQGLSVQCDDLEIRIDDQIIKRVDHFKSLGLTTDDHLSWCKHVDEICKREESLRLYRRPQTSAALYIERNCNSNL